MKAQSDITIVEDMNPLVKESMTNEQKRETKRLINKALPKSTSKIIDLNFDFWLMIFTFITLTLNNFSIFFFIVFLLALSCTLKTVLFCSDKIVAFSVIIGFLIESIWLIFFI